MTGPADNALLPAGLRDVLPGDASFEAEIVGRLIGHFTRYGYERVKPPLLEFEENLLAGSGVGLSGQTFRLMDPDSHRMMALRPDMTLQVARIAATRLKNRPRPLRLSYAGQVLRVKGTQLRPERQFGQVGAELIGATSVEADTEVILMGIEALAGAGVERISVDLGIPTLIPALLAERSLDAETALRLRMALDRKDAAAVAALGGALGSSLARIMGALLAAAGPAERALKALAELDLPPPAAAQRSALTEVARRVADGIAQIGGETVGLTVDPVENRGFEYHTGVTFTFFAAAVRGELGSGGRYLAGTGTAAESATGLTLFTDTLLAALPRPTTARRLYLPLAVPAADRRRLRKEGWTTLAALAAESDPIAAARALDCDHYWRDGKIVPIDKT